MTRNEVQILDLAPIKTKCFEHAVNITRNGIYKPDEVMEEAKKIFAWVMKFEDINPQKAMEELNKYS